MQSGRTPLKREKMHSLTMYRTQLKGRGWIGALDLDQDLEIVHQSKDSVAHPARVQS